MSSLHVITSIPQNVRGGSGCYVGLSTLLEQLRRFGIGINLVTPRIPTPFYTTTRLAFNQMLRWRRLKGEATIGIDADGYTVAGARRQTPHVACIKGVLGDAVPFERGATRLSMAFQAGLEKEHARRADLVVTVSRYCAGRLGDLYGVSNAVVVPELIDLDRWSLLFRENPASPDPRKFTVLTVCRFYPRKRVETLLRAAAVLRGRIPNLSIRIVGNGPEGRKLRAIHRELALDTTVKWLGDVGMKTLASEYNRADVFCLPSLQEGFGIVFLEAMAAGKPIVAMRAAAVPEVVRHGLLVEPDDPEALAEALFTYYSDPEMRAADAAAGRRDVEQFDAGRVASRFLAAIAKVAPGIAERCSLPCE